MKAKLFKTISKGLAIGASVLALAAPAGAATYINLYGASAQFNFWSNYAKTFMGLSTIPVYGGSSINGPACSSVSGPYITADGNSAIVIGTNCANIQDAGNAPSGLPNTSGTVYFSYSSEASWDGVDAALGVYDLANLGYSSQPCSSGTMRPVAYCGSSTGNACVTSIGNGTAAACQACGTAGSSGSASYACENITIGTSDVEAAAFTQQSNGTLNGPLDPGTSYLSHNFGATGINTSALPGGGLGGSTTYFSQYDVPDGGANFTNPETPLAYPFSLYVNPGVTAYRCNNSIPSPQTGTDYNGMYCYDDAECGGSAGGHTYCVSSTIDNLSRLQVVALYSGSIANWDDFGAAYVNLPVTLCLRHAGSGTSATLDWAVMEGNGWGAPLVQTERRSNSRLGPPYVYFNNGTGDMKNCLDWAGGETFSGADSLASNELGGGVGYMDSDNADTAYYVQVRLDGVRANRMSMHDGIYEYWTINRMYVPYDLAQGQVDFYGMMLTAINNPNNITNATVGGSRGLTYGAASELNFFKSSSGVLPYVYAPANNPANPN